MPVVRWIKRLWVNEELLDDGGPEGVVVRAVRKER